MAQRANPALIKAPSLQSLVPPLKVDEHGVDKAEVQGGPRVKTSFALSFVFILTS